jgi:TupA-like ATPgrasp
LPIRHADRDSFVARLRLKQRLARQRIRLARLLGLRRIPFEVAMFRATFGSDAEAVAYTYALHNDHLPDLENPVWINEKIRWQFLHHPNPLMTLAADKIAVRDYLGYQRADVSAPALLATGSDPRSLMGIDLPDRFVLKSAKGCGHVHIADGSKPLDRRALARKAAGWMQSGEHWCYTGELHYRGIPSRWLVEEYLPASREKLEFKVHCMGGEPVFIGVITERGPKGRKHVYFDPDWNRLAFSSPGVEDDTRAVPRPDDLERILSEARRLSRDFLHVRVDFLKHDGRLAFSELTFASRGARFPYLPREVNSWLGRQMDLGPADELLERGRRIARALGWRPDPAVARPEPVVAAGGRLAAADA